MRTSIAVFLCAALLIGAETNICGGGLVYYATPRGNDTTKFALTSLTSDGSSRQAVFENPEHDFPILVRYTLSEDGLMAEVEGIDDDHTVVEVWVWQRAEFPRNTAR